MMILTSSPIPFDFNIPQKYLLQHADDWLRISLSQEQKSK
jgi:hypothetical protein